MVAIIVVAIIVAAIHAHLVVREAVEAVVILVQVQVTNKKGKNYEKNTNKYSY
jgi:hypothetical protein